MRWLYNLSVRAYGLAIRLASPFVPKARLWVQGRKNWPEALKSATKGKSDWIWFHCASLGEFEQGRPLMEAIRKEYPQFPILLTFYSPSGYEIRKNYAGADHICYMPLDTGENAKVFCDIIRPKFAIFVKYEIWANFLAELSSRQIAVYLASCMVRKNSRFFRGMQKEIFRDAFKSFKWIFAQTPEVVDILREFTGKDHISLSGDTRFDRVLEIRDKFSPIREMGNFLSDEFCVVCGSTWPKDEEIILQVAAELQDLPIKWIVAPHEINQIRILSTVSKHPYEMITWSAIEKCDPEYRVLWIDNIGMLSRLYHYGTIAYIGGGYAHGVHNTLEATAYGCPVAFGPKYQKFNEILALVERGGGAPVTNAKALKAWVLRFYENREELKKVRQENLQFMEENKGATAIILQKIKELEAL